MIESECIESRRSLGSMCCGACVVCRVKLLNKACIQFKMSIVEKIVNATKVVWCNMSNEVERWRWE
jgi:hypothetical protein